MGQKFRDEAGHIWEMGPDGQPRLVSQGGPNVVMPTPADPNAGLKRQLLEAQVTNAQRGPVGKSSYRVLSQQEKIQRGLDPAGDYQVSSEGQVSPIASPRNQNNQLTAVERSKAIQGYTDAASLEAIADKLERQFKAGPGATRGIAGAADYLPTPANKTFNDTSFQARGLVKRAMGFTGGEGNTIGEIQLNYGPYLPEAGDYDERILNKVEALRGLAQQSRQRAIAVLGGVPDRNGRITPVTDDQQAVPPSLSNDGAPTIEAGQYRDPRFAGIEGQYRQMLAKGEAPGKIIQFLQSQGISANPQDVVEQSRWVKKNPGKINQLDTSQIEMVWRDKITRNTLGINPDSPVGAYGIAAANALTAGTLDELAGGESQAAKDTLRQRNPYASLAGDISGAALGMTGLNAGVRGVGSIAPLATRAGGLGTDAIYGAAYGAGESNDDRLTGAATGAASAGAGNLLGRGIVSGAGRAVRGVADPHIRHLADLGIPMTPGQIAGQGGMVGRGARALEDIFESIPFVGAGIKQRKSEGLQAFNREAFKDALAPINQQVEGTIGQDAVGEAQDLVSGAYGDALNGTMLRADKPFLMETDDIIKRGSRVPVAGEQFNYLMENKVDPLFNSNLELNGKRFQAALQTLSKAKPEFNKMGIMGNQVAENVGEMRNAFTDLAGRQMPETMPALNAANAANKNVSILGDTVTQAVNNSVESGMFTPAQLARKAVDNTKKFGGRKAAARGNVPFRELTEAGQAVLPNVVPNSGTTDRALATMLLPAGLGGAAAGSNILGLPDEVTATLAGLSLLSTKRGNKLFQKLAVDRPDAARLLGENILKLRRPGGMFGSAAALPFLAPLDQ